MVGYSTTAMFNLGLLYHLGGDGLQPDPAKALRWWNLADAAGSGTAGRPSFVRQPSGPCSTAWGHRNTAAGQRQRKRRTIWRCST